PSRHDGFSWCTIGAKSVAARSPDHAAPPDRRSPRFDTIRFMSDFRSMARDPEHRRNFEKLLYLAAQRGDADLVAERLSWGIDPNCTFTQGRTPLIANVRGSCPSAVTVRALLQGGADPGLADETGLTALNY